MRLRGDDTNDDKCAQLTDFPEQKTKRKYRTRLEHNEIPNSVRIMMIILYLLSIFSFCDSSLFYLFLTCCLVQYMSLHTYMNFSFLFFSFYVARIEGCLLYAWIGNYFLIVLYVVGVC